VSFNDFLKGKVGLNDILYTHYSGLHIIPASLNLDDLTGITANPEYLKQTLRDVFASYDFVILDSAPGVGNEALLALTAADEVLFVATPTIPALVDVVKTKDFLARLHKKHSAIGIVINRVKGKSHEMSADEIRHFTDLPVVGVVPEDEGIIRSENRRELITSSDPRSPAARAVYRIATRMAGVSNPIYVPDDLYKNKSIFRRFLDRFKGSRD
jgi:MinD-like ATPase involved in chromosome partitioning or flagellar assembly